MTLIDKIKQIPHKNLFYLGFLVVFVFISLSYWQLTRHQQDKLIIDSIDSKDFINEISVSDLYDLNKFEEFTKIQLTEKLENIDLVRTWYLRSRVHNGENGYHLVSLYGTELEEYFLINNGWVPLNKNADKTFLYKNPNFKGRLLSYDIQGVGQDDIPDSDYLFRIDKSFIESETGVILPEFYIVLIDDCGSGVECINLEEPYDAPHLSYAFQWAFFALCLTIVVLRKNNIITWKK